MTTKGQEKLKRRAKRRRDQQHKPADSGRYLARTKSLLIGKDMIARTRGDAEISNYDAAKELLGTDYVFDMGREHVVERRFRVRRRVCDRLYTEGQKACHEGIKFEYNPYRNTYGRHEWDRGWRREYNRTR